MTLTLKPSEIAKQKATEFVKSRQQETRILNDCYPHASTTPAVRSTLEHSEILMACISAKARNIWGLGFKFVPINKETYDEKSPLVRQELEFLKYLFSGEQGEVDYSANQDLPFSEMLRRCGLDYEAFGFGGLELVRDDKGNPAAFYHIPSMNLYIARGGKGYVQKVPGEKDIWFAKIGSPPINKKDGTLLASASYADPLCASEAWVFLAYQPGFENAGYPKWKIAHWALDSSYKINERNYCFFKNYAIPYAFMVFLDSKVQTDDKKKNPDSRTARMRALFKGTDKYGRIQPIFIDRVKQRALDEPNRPAVQYIPTETISSQDASFQQAQGANEERIRNLYGLSKTGIGISDDVNLANAEMGRENDEKNVYLPERKLLEYAINLQILSKLGIVFHKMELIGLNISDDAQSADLANKRLPGMTLNEYREANGLAPMEDERGEMLMSDLSKVTSATVAIPAASTAPPATIKRRRKVDNANLELDPIIRGTINRLYTNISDGLNDIYGILVNGLSVQRAAKKRLPTWYDPDLLGDDLRDWEGLDELAPTYEAGTDDEKRAITGKAILIGTVLYAGLMASSRYDELGTAYEYGVNNAQAEAPAIPVNGVEMASSFIREHAYDKGKLVKLTGTEKNALGQYFERAIKDGIPIKGKGGMLETLKRNFFPNLVDPNSKNADWKIMRIARQETLTAYRRGYMDSMGTIEGLVYNFIFGRGELACEICKEIAANNPYTKNEIMEYVEGGHIQCYCGIQAEIPAEMNDELGIEVE